jgi:hypothetical protein
MAIAVSPAKSTHIDGLEGYWKFDEGSGSTALDSSGHGHDGTIFGAVYSNDVSPAVGSAFSLGFNGASDAVDVAPAPAFDFTNADPLTIALWFKKSASPEIYHLIGKRTGCSDAPINYQLARDSTFGLAFNSAGGGSVPTGVSDVPVGVWTHIAATYDPAQHLLQTYLNGAKTGSASGYMLGGVDSGNQDLQIATSGWCPQYFPGNIDDVRVYRRTLPASEIATLASKPMGVSGELAALIAYVDSNGLGPGASLSSKLQETLASVNISCNKLAAFLNEVKAQTGKKLSPADAAYLTSAANRIGAELGC